MFEPSLHWVAGIAPCRLALMPRPRGGDWLRDEVGAWRNVGIKSVVSLLEAREIHDLDLRAEPDLCVEHGIQFRSFPIPDRGTPASAQGLCAMLAQLHAELLQGHAVAIHCRAGIGRTGLVAGCMLHLLQVPYEDIFHLLSRSRGLAVPDTAAQADWVEKFARTTR